MDEKEFLTTITKPIATETFSSIFIIKEGCSIDETKKQEKIDSIIELFTTLKEEFKKGNLILPQTESSSSTPAEKNDNSAGSEPTNKRASSPTEEQPTSKKSKLTPV